VPRSSVMRKTGARRLSPGHPILTNIAHRLENADETPEVPRWIRAA
jgi:hypothetical protein